MPDLEENTTNEWKSALRSALIAGIAGDEAAMTQAFVDVGYYYMCCAPTSLYKYYRDSTRDLDAVKHNKMWYSAPCVFNDVFDCDLAISASDILHSVLQMIPDKRGVRIGSPMWRTLNDNVNQQIKAFQSDFEKLRAKIGITCLSESNDSLLMWAHYANNHRGMCVEYELLEFNTRLRFSPVPIIYSEERVSIHAIETLEQDIQVKLIESLTSKSPEWSYEREWRIIREDNACGDKWNAEKKGALLDSIRPKSVILGCMATSEFEQNVREYCETNKINLFKMRKNEERYCLEKAPILQYSE